METEFENLSQLLEAISLTKDAEKNLADAQEEFNAAETTENKNTAQEKVAARTRELAVQKERTNLLRLSVRTHFAAGPSNETVEDAEKPVPVDKKQVKSSSRLGTMSLKLPQLEKFQRGDNFSKFCEKFLEYVTLGNIDSDNLPLLFLQLVDDFTRERLKKIILTTGQRKDPKQFIEEYMKKICPPHEGSWNETETKWRER